MKITILSAILYAVFTLEVLAADHPTLEQFKMDKAKLTLGTRFVSSAARGFITGYKKGMYRLTRYMADPNCFNNRT